MITFKSTNDLNKLSPANPIYPTIQELVLQILSEHPDYCSEEDGYIVLIDPEDVDLVLHDLDLPWRISEIPFEGC